MFRAYRRFHKLHESASAQASFVRGDVTIAGPRTLINFSLWRDVRGMLLWTGTHEHVRAVQWTYSRTTEKWSAYFSLVHASRSASEWRGRILDAPYSSSFLDPSSDVLRALPKG
jgi:hypothetical protein